MTAQRRAQNLQDVPIAVTALSAKDLAQQQVNTTADLPRLVPNMFTNNNTGTGSGNVYFLRGLGQTESFPTFDPQVGTYVDDIYIGRESASNFGLFDVDQIQVLRGPQGTLFGRNATGGAIVVSLAKPAAEFGGYVDAGYGSYNRFFGKASVNVPLNEQILTKTSVYGLRDDGYADDLATGQKLNGHGDYGVRESLLLKPSALDNVTWYLSADYEDADYNAVQNSPSGDKRVSYSGFGVLSSPINVIGGPAILNDFNNILKEPVTGLANGEDLVTWGAMSNIQAVFDAGTLNFISGLRAQRQLGASDFPFPGVSGPLVPYDNNYLGQFGIVLNSLDDQYSQEVKWTGKLGSRLDYTAGLFYLFERNSSDFLETLTIPVAPTSVLGLELNTPQHFHNVTYSKAAYAQADYAVDDHLTVTAGARFTDEEKGFDASGDLSKGGYDTAGVLAAGNRTHLSTDQFTPRFSLQYRFNPEIMAFASATRGFQGGGWNSLTNSAAEVSAFGPETVWTYETGIRTETPDKKLRVNADFFYNDVHNYQLITLAPGGGANFITENAADMIAYGLEADILYKPIDNLTLSGTVGLQNGYYIDPSLSTASQQEGCKAGNTSLCSGGIVNANGNLAQPEDFPPVTATLKATYNWDLADFRLTPNAAVQYMAANHVDTAGTPGGLSGAHLLLDMGMTFQVNDAPWYVTAECQNCTKTNYQTALLFIPYYNVPGTWDVKFHWAF